MTSAVGDFGAFQLAVDDLGIGVVTFDRAPVNAVSLSVYDDLSGLIDHLADSDVRVVVLTAPPKARAWCGGADLRDFVGMDVERRHERYEFINSVVPRFAALDRPTIAAIGSHVVGVGVIIAGLCDMRVASGEATFSCPEIDYGLVGGGAGLFSHLNLPDALVREMLFTGRRFTAAEMDRHGFLNRVVPRAEVLPEAMRLAGTIAAKSLPSLRARKRVLVEIEQMSWLDGYLHAQRASAELVPLEDSAEGVQAFLDRRTASVSDG